MRTKHFTETRFGTKKAAEAAAAELNERPTIHAGVRKAGTRTWILECDVVHVNKDFVETLNADFEAIEKFGPTARQFLLA